MYKNNFYFLFAQMLIGDRRDFLIALGIVFWTLSSLAGFAADYLLTRRLFEKCFESSLRKIAGIPLLHLFSLSYLKLKSLPSRWHYPEIIDRGMSFLMLIMEILYWIIAFLFPIVFLSSKAAPERFLHFCSAALLPLFLCSFFLNFPMIGSLRKERGSKFLLTLLYILPFTKVFCCFFLISQIGERERN